MRSRVAVMSAIHQRLIAHVRVVIWAVTMAVSTPINFSATAMLKVAIQVVEMGRDTG